MQAEEARVRYLFQRYFDKTAGPEERDELARLITDDNNKALFMQLLGAAWDGYEGDGDILPDNKRSDILNNILVKEAPTAIQAPVRKLLWPRIAAAAAILVVIAGAAWFFLKAPAKQVAPVVQQVAHDASPGSFKARLTLADGRQITLDNAAPGELIKQGNTSVINKDSGLTYQPANGNHPLIYNTITTNRGETYSFTLADGSKIWMNAASSVHFPVAFAGNERRIEITGEVFIEVAKDHRHPFIVSARGMEVRALGTAFNINAYNDETNISTTLVDGSVQVSKQNASTILKPGEQTHLLADGKLSAPEQVNTEEIISWKDGYFQFESADLKTILRQFARWYDVEVVYEGPVKNRKFFGMVKRSSSLKNVLALLQDNNIVYKIEGKKLIVSQ